MRIKAAASARSIHTDSSRRHRQPPKGSLAANLGRRPDTPGGEQQTGNQAFNYSTGRRTTRSASIITVLEPVGKDVDLLLEIVALKGEAAIVFAKARHFPLQLLQLLCQTNLHPAVRRLCHSEWGTKEGLRQRKGNG